MRLYRWPLLRPLFLAWWRWHERDVLDARNNSQTTRGAPSYEYGKVTGLAPDLVVITEVTESPYVCCGYCSAGMASWVGKKGVTHSMAGAAHPIRSAGGRPHNNGSKASELRNGARSAHGVTLDALAVDEIPGALRDGMAVVVNLDYAQLPGWLQVQSGSFGHSCCLYGWQEANDRVGFFDPLWPEGARGAWAPWSQVRAALWGDGEHSATVTSWAPAPVPPPAPTEPDCPDCPPPEEHTPDELEQLQRDVYAQAVQDRDAAWRNVQDVAQPRLSASWVDGSPSTWYAPRWSTFARWAPEPPVETWNGPATAWDDTAWT